MRFGRKTKKSIWMMVAFALLLMCFCVGCNNKEQPGEIPEPKENVLEDISCC